MSVLIDDRRRSSIKTKIRARKCLGYLGDFSTLNIEFNIHLLQYNYSTTLLFCAILQQLSFAACSEEPLSHLHNGIAMHY